MKKFFAILAAAVVSISASAQEPAVGFYGNKMWDNWYVGAFAGGASKTTHQAVLKNINPEFGVRVGKWFTPVVGVAAEGQLYVDNKVSGHEYTLDRSFRKVQVNLLATINLTNWILGYNGEPRAFEVMPVIGLGWGRNFGYANSDLDKKKGTRLNQMEQKLAIDFAYNFGDKKQWQLYVEPAINYAIAGAKDERWNTKVGYDANFSHLQLNVGLNYFFKTSNGTHRFVNVVECDQNEIDALNANITDLRAKNAADADEIAKLKKEINDLKKALRDAEEIARQKSNVQPNLPSVFYALDKTVINKEQAKNVAIAAAVLKNHPELKVAIKGYASPEGPHDHNNDLSVGRAKAVKDMLVKKFGIDESRISTEGCGETDQLFEIFELNRVAMLYLVK